MLNKNWIFCFLFRLLDLSSATTDYGQCRAQNNEVSTCIELSECNSLNSLTRKADLTSEERLFLKNSQCGYINKKVLVCCPLQAANKQEFGNPLMPQSPLKNISTTNRQIGVVGFPAADYGSCITPKNEYSFCIELNKCDVLYTLIQKVDLSIADRIFLRQSQCGYRDNRVLVCCPLEELEDSEINLLPEAPECGTMLTSRIIGGNIASIDEFPWMALIEYTKPGGDKGYQCGGTLINIRYVITAAHCLMTIPSGLRVTGLRLGEWNLNTNPDCEADMRGRKYCALPHIDVGIEKVITHPQYDPRSRSQENDIALLRMSENIKPNEFVKPICLPFDVSLRRSSFAGQDMIVAGWGRTENARSSNLKLKAAVKVWDDERCKQVYTSKEINLQSTQMCAGGTDHTDSCQGDSGGPLVIEKKIKNMASFFLIGIVSFGPNPCGTAGWPGIYTRVVNYTDWIKNNIKP